MGSDFVNIPELDSGETLNSSPPAPVTLPPPPPLTPSPAAMEEVSLATQSSPLTLPPLSPTALLQKSELQVKQDGEIQSKFLPAPVTFSMVTQPILPLMDSASNSAATITNNTGGLQIMTRKRSSMSAAKCGASVPAIPASSKSSNNNTTSQPLEIEVPTRQPPTKKKKYTPKPKKTTANSTVAITENTSTTANGSNSKSAKSKSKKISEANNNPSFTATSCTFGAEAAARPAAKPKNPSKSKATKKPPSTTTAGSSKNKSRAKQAPSVENKAFVQVEGSTTVRYETNSSAGTTGHNHQPLVPPLRLQMPKLMKMPGTCEKNLPVMPILPLKIKKDDAQDWGDQVDTVTTAAETEMHEDGSDESGNCKISSRKKKSKGRNGNIYIGVFNRIEWMKLQNEFGFGSVNNFGTFVLQTMRRVHGDIQFWCDVSKASGVHTDLDRYKWVNGFPHAVNMDGQYFTPEPDVTMTDDKLKEVVVMAKGMWDQRLQKLQEQQQNLTGEDDAAIVLDGVAEDGEEDEDDMPELENYLENMASGQYCSPPASLVGGTSNPSSGAVKAKTLTEEEVNKIWNDQMNDSESLEKFGKLFRFINSVATLGGTHQAEKKENENRPTSGAGIVEGVKKTRDSSDRGYILEENIKKTEERDVE